MTQFLFPLRDLFVNTATAQKKHRLTEKKLRTSCNLGHSVVRNILNILFCDALVSQCMKQDMSTLKVPYEL